MHEKIKTIKLNFAPLQTIKEKRALVTGFTLIELITVVIIIAILASLAVPNYIKTVERAKDKEAIVNLKLIMAAEKIYKMGNGNYYPPGNTQTSDINAINLGLGLDLNVSTWNYLIMTYSPGGVHMEADRQIGSPQNPPQGYQRNWWMNYTMDEPECTIFSGGNANACPPP